MKKVMVATLLIIITFFSITKGQNSIAQYCHQAKSCGACIKIHSDCGWCSDQNFNGEHRCDSKENLHQTCYGQSLVHQPPPSMEITQAFEFGEKQHYNPSEIHQLKPQQLHFHMKPGDTMHFQMQFKYLKKMDEDIAHIRTSDADKMGLSLAFTNDCPYNRQRPVYEDQGNQAGLVCHDIKVGETITFNISVSLRDCVTEGDAVVSIGLAGVRDVMAIYVTPLCGCDCEKVENHDVDSPYCSRRGNIICGACVCQNGYDGQRCEHQCDPSDTTCMQMRIPPHRPHVVQPTPSVIPTTECVDSCPRHHGLICSGRGICNCEICKCFDGWMGYACECPESKDACLTPDGSTCSNNGVCICGVCKCSDESLRTKYCESDVPENPDDGDDRPHIQPDPNKSYPEETHPGHGSHDGQERPDIHQPDEESDETRDHEDDSVAHPPPPQIPNLTPEPPVPTQIPSAEPEPEPPGTEQPTTLPPQGEPEPKSESVHPAENPEMPDKDEKNKDDAGGQASGQSAHDSATTKPPSGGSNVLSINLSLIFSSLFLVGYLSRWLLFSCSL